jgi:hypothetical protein
MATYTMSPADLHAVQGKTIIITGGVTGIGRAAVDIALGKFISGGAAAAELPH